MKDEQKFARESEDVPDRGNCMRATEDDRALGNAGDGKRRRHAQGCITVTGDRAARQVWTCKWIPWPPP